MSVGSVLASPPLPLPIDEHIPAIVAAVRSSRAVVVTASPGAGKTTRVPPALVEDGPVIVLQPRRVAARAIARRIAGERGWTVGREVGWHVRFDRRSSPETRLLVATEGILTAHLLQDPLLADFRTIVIDEFHERSIHADLGLALARQAWLARGDLRIVVMSATIDPAPVAAFLSNCPIIDVPGRTFPLDVDYQPGTLVEQACAAAVSRTHGALLCFLPGAGEIRRTAEAIDHTPSLSGIPVWPLHGGLDAEAQDAAIRPASGRRIVLATNLAETTLTVPDVTCVIDTGLHKVARYDPDRGIDSLETERISKDSADQRAGRAGRLQAGVAVRLWDARDRLTPHREPEIARVDLAAPALDVLAWGGDPRAFEWFDAPPPGALDAALGLLTRLGALDPAGRIAALGRQLQRLPLHPRLARIMMAAGGAPEAARACALLSERHFFTERGAGARTTECDLLAAIDRDRVLPPHVTRAAHDIREAARRVLDRPPLDRLDDESFRRAVLAGYPDRVAQRRGLGSDRVLLASGTGARLARESGVRHAAYLIAVDVTAGSGAGPGRSSPASEALVRMATGVEADWLSPTSRETRHRIDRGVVRAAVLDRYDALILRESPCPPDPDEAERLITDEYIRRGPTSDDVQLLRRLAFAGAPAAFDALARHAAAGATKLQDVDLSRHLSQAQRRALAGGAPEAITVPSGRSVRLMYRDDGSVTAAVKLQELFGLAETPRLGPGRVPVTFELLAPSGRPVQVTRDLRSFWTRGYPEVRKELRARYPKHPWPEDPWMATPSRRPK